MDEPIRVAHLRKDPLRESRLQELNELLAPVERQIELGVDVGEPPLVFVIGMARSGTTLAGQLLAGAGFGYVSNFIASFWKAPALGATLQRLILNSPGTLASSFRSYHGVTEGLLEPHEFGYFWDRWFDLGQPTHKLDSTGLSRVDREGLRNALTALQKVEGRPFSFKNNSWCSLQASWLAHTFPRSIFVMCRRPACWVAQSLCQAREERYGSRDTWWSIRPSTYTSLIGLPWWDQIAAQIHDFDVEMREQLAQIPPYRVIDISYSAMCENPRDLIERTTLQLHAMGIEFTPAYDRIPKRLVSRDYQRLANADWLRLNNAIEQRGLPRQCKVT